LGAPGQNNTMVGQQKLHEPAHEQSVHWHFLSRFSRRGEKDAGGCQLEVRRVWTSPGQTVFLDIFLVVTEKKNMVAVVN
jgi:hypothetical protein